MPIIDNIPERHLENIKRGYENLKRIYERFRDRTDRVVRDDEHIRGMEEFEEKLARDEPYIQDELKRALREQDTDAIRHHEREIKKHREKRDRVHQDIVQFYANRDQHLAEAEELLRRLNYEREELTNALSLSPREVIRAHAKSGSVKFDVGSNTVTIPIGEEHKIRDQLQDASAQRPIRIHSIRAVHSRQGVNSELVSENSKIPLPRRTGTSPRDGVPCL